MTVHYAVLQTVGDSPNDDAQVYIGIDPSKNPPPPAGSSQSAGVPVDISVLQGPQTPHSETVHTNGEGFAKSSAFSIAATPLSLLKVESTETSAVNLILKPDAPGTGDGRNFLVVPPATKSVGSSFQLLRREGNNLNPFILIGNPDLATTATVTIKKGTGATQTIQILPKMAAMVPFEPPAGWIRVDAANADVFVQYAFNKGRKADFVLPL